MLDRLSGRHAGFRVVCGLSVHRFCLSCDVLVLGIEAHFFTPSADLFCI